MSLSQGGFYSGGPSSPTWRDHRRRGYWWRFRLLIIHDESRTTVSSQEQPGPLQKHADPLTELSQIKDVNKRPRQPREKTMYAHFAALQNGPPFPDHSHVAFVEIAKRLRRLLAGKSAA